MTERDEITEAVVLKLISEREMLVARKDLIEKRICQVDRKVWSEIKKMSNYGKSE